jgi:hypothetical protein
MTIIQSRVRARSQDEAAMKIRDEFPDAGKLSLRFVLPGWYEYRLVLEGESDGV